MTSEINKGKMLNVTLHNSEKKQSWSFFMFIAEFPKTFWQKTALN